MGVVLALKYVIVCFLQNEQLLAKILFRVDFSETQGTNLVYARVPPSFIRPVIMI